MVWRLDKCSWEFTRNLLWTSCEPGNRRQTLATLGHDVGHQGWRVAFWIRGHTQTSVKPQIAVCRHELHFRLERSSQLHSHMWPLTHLLSAYVVWKRATRYINNRCKLYTVLIFPGLCIPLSYLSLYPFGACHLLHFACNKHSVAHYVKVHTEKELERLELPCRLSR